MNRPLPTIVIFSLIRLSLSTKTAQVIQVDCSADTHRLNTSITAQQHTRHGEDYSSMEALFSFKDRWDELVAEYLQLSHNIHTDVKSQVPLTQLRFCSIYCAAVSSTQDLFDLNGTQPSLVSLLTTGVCLQNAKGRMHRRAFCTVSSGFTTPKHGAEQEACV